MGSDVDCMEYVKQADFANEKQKQVWGIPSLEFVLYYMCDGDRFVPFSLLENAAGKIIDKYNVLSQDHTQGPVDEQMAMAAVLMVTIGYELQKLFVLRSQVKVHQQKLLNVDSPSAPIRRLALPDEYTKYHIDIFSVCSQCSSCWLPFICIRSNKSFRTSFCVREFYFDFHKLGQGDTRL